MARGAARGSVAEPPPRQDRDPWLDNTRFLAAVLVASFHFLELHMAHGSFVEWLWGATWGFRLPVFAVLAGLFSTAEPGPRGMRSMIRRVVFPLAVVTVVHWLLYWARTGDLAARPSEPVYTLWFLYGIILWRIVLPYLAVLKRPIVWSVIVALVVAIPQLYDNAWSLPGILAHLPFFLLGWKLKDHLDLLRRRRVGTTVAASGIVLIVPVVTAVLALLGIYSTMPQRLHPPYEHDVGWLMVAEAGLRLLIIVVGAFTALAVLHLMPRRHLPVISLVGSHGFTVYLLHALVVVALRALGVLTEGDGSITNPSVWLDLAIAITVVLLLGSTPVHRSMRWLIRPRLDWLFADPATSRESGGSHR